MKLTSQMPAYRRKREAFAAGLFPSATVAINSYPQTENDPFNPVAAGVALLDEWKSSSDCKWTSRLECAANHQRLSAGTSLTGSVSLNYPFGQNTRAGHACHRCYRDSDHNFAGML